MLAALQLTTTDSGDEKWEILFVGSKAHLLSSFSNFIGGFLMALAQIRFAAYNENQSKVNLTVAEIGVFLTGVNRSFNQYAAQVVESNPDLTSKKRDDSKEHLASMSEEPSLIRLEVTEIRQGSVEIQAAIDFFAAIGLDPATAKGALIGILTQALGDKKRCKNFENQFQKAIRRIARSSPPKIFQMQIKLGGKNLAYWFKVGTDHEVTAYTPKDNLKVDPKWDIES
jgi:hypothetical protein